jgi:hypothetical protein
MIKISSIGRKQLKEQPENYNFITTTIKIIVKIYNYIIFI